MEEVGTRSLFVVVNLLLLILSYKLNTVSVNQSFLTRPFQELEFKVS